MKRFAHKLYKSILSYETRLRLYKLRHPGEYKKLRSVVHPSDKGDFSLKPYDEHKCIFIHITKTAGTSVSRSLFDYLPYHYTAIEYRVIYGRRTFEKYYKFAFVRNPWDRTYSAYRYLKAGGWNEEDKLWDEANLAQFQDFNSFVKYWLTPQNIRKHIHFMPQYHFICDSNKRLLLDYLAYFETINEDFEKICSKLDIDTKLGRHNANPDNDYRAAYDDESRDIVTNVYSDDIEMFGYDFNGISNRKIIN